MTMLVRFVIMIKLGMGKDCIFTLLWNVNTESQGNLKDE